MDSLGVCIHFEDQGLKTRDDDGKENYVATLMIATLGTVAQLEKSIQRERQIEGIRLAKLRSDSPYKGRLKGTTENVLQFLNKEKNT